MTFSLSICILHFGFPRASALTCLLFPRRVRASLATFFGRVLGGDTYDASGSRSEFGGRSTCASCESTSSSATRGMQPATSTRPSRSCGRAYATPVRRHWPERMRIHRTVCFETFRQSVACCLRTQVYYARVHSQVLMIMAGLLGISMYVLSTSVLLFRYSFWATHAEAQGYISFV